MLAFNRLISGEVVEGFNVTPSSPAGMSVLVQPGSALMPTGTAPGHYKLPVAHDTSAGESVTIATANSQPRIDIVVAYVDTSLPLDITNANNPGKLKFKAVTGTPNASPVEPNAAAIQSSVGAANPYIIIGRVDVAASAPSITTPNITDRRVIAMPNLANEGVTGDKLESTQWRVIGSSTTVTSNATIVEWTPRYKHIRFLCDFRVGGDIQLQFKNRNTGLWGVADYALQYLSIVNTSVSAGMQTGRITALSGAVSGSNKPGTLTGTFTADGGSRCLGQALLGLYGSDGASYNGTYVAYEPSSYSGISGVRISSGSGTLAMANLIVEGRG